MIEGSGLPTCVPIIRGIQCVDQPAPPIHVWVAAFAAMTGLVVQLTRRAGCTRIFEPLYQFRHGREGGHPDMVQMSIVSCNWTPCTP